ncbi:FecR family protein [Telmatospirillum siberiense]|uniref:FecR family protein n=1 Tax=Telmatospirillum siberiense TaxID=382514 RepID=UPI0013047A55|nr:FecR domain-containing protein [Telmatospirillum siberiense]
MSDTALEWLVLLDDGGAPALREACAAWRAADPAHERAWQEALALWRSPELAVALAVDRPLRRREPAGSIRRLTALAAMLALAIFGAAWSIPSPIAPLRWALADLRAPLHDLRALTLPDGTRITLDAASAADMAFTPDRRRLRLQGGRMVVEAAHDASRPLEVETDLGVVTVVGTRFLVDTAPGELSVAVQEGRVAVESRAGNVLLTPGQRLRLEDGAEGGAPPSSVVEPVDPDLVADAAGGWRNFKGTPLAEVLAEIGRYRWAPILLADHALDALPVTARLQVAAPERALAALASTMPVSFEAWPGGVLLAAPSNPPK